MHGAKDFECEVASTLHSPKICRPDRTLAHWRERNVSVMFLLWRKRNATVSARFLSKRPSKSLGPPPPIWQRIVCKRPKQAFAAWQPGHAHFQSGHASRT